MFCPKCKSEYRQGFTICSDCGTELVGELPIEYKSIDKKLEFINYDLLLSTYNIADIAIIKSVLNSEGIIHFVQGETSINLTGGGASRVLVKKEQLVTARELLKDLRLKFTSL